jgi:hypothetical protein
VEEFIDNVNNKAYLVLERAGDLSLEQLVEESPQGLALEQIKTIIDSFVKQCINCKMI